MKLIMKESLHRLPEDVRKALAARAAAGSAWKTLTPLARNEFVCWVISVKKMETRQQHIKRLCEDLVKGKRRPCCFAGCVHRHAK
jgi:uncharacterized protein YdeI (YjbR/CyaY-like superfamily)